VASNLLANKEIASGDKRPRNDMVNNYRSVTASLKNKYKAIKMAMIAIINGRTLARRSTMNVTQRPATPTMDKSQGIDAFAVIEIIETSLLFRISDDHP
jgi:hypothetical protein